MVTFNVDCVACRQPLTLTANEIRVVECAGRVTWSYRCRRCSANVIRDADEHQLLVLRHGGLKPRQVPVPRQPSIGGLPPTGEPLTEDEVIAFGLWLEAAPSAVTS